MSHRDIPCAFYWVNSGIFLLIIPIAIWALCKQYKQQKIKKTCCWSYISTCSFYISVILHAVSTLIDNIIKRDCSEITFVNQEFDIIHTLIPTLWQLEWIFVLIILFIR